MEKQKHNKDCLQTVLSEGLKIDYDLIPRFYENDKTWDKQYNHWLQRHNLFRVIFDLKFSDNLKFPYCSQMPELFIGILHKESNKYDHAVILKFEDNNVIMHDPKPNSDYDLTDLIQVEMLFKTTNQKWECAIR